MKRSCILAHRGMFLNESEQNTPKALIAALSEGFGVETDLRDLDGKVVISHDPPRKDTQDTTFEWFLEILVSSSQTGRIGLNIKSNGLSKMIESEIRSTGIDPARFFVFDMSIPDSLPYLQGHIHFYSRISDYELNPAFLDKAKGVWVDNLNGSVQQVARARYFMERGYRVAIVSPELHGRDRSSVWNEIKETGLHLSPLFEICTDFPIEAAGQFCEA